MSQLTIGDVLDVEYPGVSKWSADGRYLAATIYVDDGPSLSIVDTDHPGDPWRVALDGASVATVAWAPKPTSARMAVVSGEGQLFLVDAEDETVEQCTGHADSDDLAWSDDGRVAFYRDGTPTVLDTGINTDHRFDVPERGTFLGEAEMLAWGPNDRYLAYRFVDFDAKQVGVVDTEDGGLVWRSREQGHSTSTPQWLDDGQVLVDRSGEHGTVREVVAIAVDDGTEQVLYREEAPENGTISRGAPVISPDGARVAMALPEDGWEHIHVIDVVTGERTQLTEGTFEDKGLADSRSPVALGVGGGLRVEPGGPRSARTLRG